MIMFNSYVYQKVINQSGWIPHVPYGNAQMIDLVMNLDGYGLGDDIEIHKNILTSYLWFIYGYSMVYLWIIHGYG